MDTQDTLNEETPLVSEEIGDDTELAYNESVSTYLAGAEGSERKNELATVWPAAHLIRDAILGESEEPSDSWYDPHSNPENEKRNKFCILCHHAESHINGLLKVTMWVLVLITFFEPPYWCRGLDLETDHAFGSCGAVLDARDPTDETIQYYPNFGLMIMTEKQAHVLQLLCIFILSTRLFIRIGRNGFELSRFFHPQVRYSNGLRVLMLLLLLLPGTSVCHPFFRLLLLGTYLKDCRKEFASVIELIPDVVSIMSIVAVIIAFYSVVGVLLFDVSEQGQRDFPDWVEGVWTLWICLTTANYPDVMMPSYNNHRVSNIFWISFMVIVFFLLMNMVLASVVERYDDVMEKRKKRDHERLQSNLSSAYELMKRPDTNEVDHDTIIALFVVLNDDFPEIKKFPRDATDKLFSKLDINNSDSINEEEFQQFGQAFNAFVTDPDYTTLIQKRFPTIYEHERFKKLEDLVRNPKSERFIDFILVLNAVVVVIESWKELAGEYIENDTAGYNGEVNSFWDFLETLFTVFYTVEVVAKIAVDGWKKYSELPRNMFDFTITLSVLVACTYLYFANDYNGSTLITVVVMLRVFRLGRLLMSFPAFRDITSITLKIIPESLSVLQLLFFVTYFFSALSVILYGGLITRDPENPLSELIAGTDFANDEYWGNNFNDMMSAMNVMFNLLVINNWTTCEGGYEAVTGGKMVRLFFFGFHIFGVVLVNNVVIAFVINAFLSHLRTSHATHAHDE